MQWIKDFFTNPYIVTGLSSWATAQIIKVIIYACIHRKFNLERMFGDGGMPSGHSAMVSSLAIFVALYHGMASFQFAICFVLAIIVCHDATGVRREAGKQAAVINELIEIIDSDKKPDVKLKELVGHTPLQVAMGILLGACMACLMRFVVFRGI